MKWITTEALEGAESQALLLHLVLRLTPEGRRQVLRILLERLEQEADA